MLNNDIIEIMKKNKTDKEIIREFYSDVKRFKDLIAQDLSQGNTEKAFYNTGRLTVSLDRFEKAMSLMDDNFNNESKE